MFDRLKELFTIDLRAAAFMRIALSSVLIVDLVFRLNYAEALYGFEGILPLDYVHQNMGARPPLFQLYFLSDATWLPVLLLSLNLLVAIFLLLGLFTRTSMFVCWLLFASLYYRNGLIHSGAESTLIMGLFWALFLPCGAYFSLDAWRKRIPRYAVSHYSPVTVAFTCQIVAYYFLSGLHKTGSEWWPEGTALYYALNLETLSSSWATLLLQYPLAMQGLSLAIWIVEAFSPLLLILLPMLFGIWLRTGTILFLILFHLGIAVFLDIGTFPYINIAILLAFLPSQFYQSIFDNFNSANKSDPLNKFQKKNLQPEHPARPIQYWSETSKLCAVFVGLVLSLVIAQGYYGYLREPTPTLIKKTARFMALRQSFRFFSPKPSKKELFWFFPGTLTDGTKVDAFNLSLAPMPIEKQFIEDYYNKVWRKYFLRFTKSRTQYKSLKSEFARYLCDRWRKNFKDTKLANLEEVSLIYLIEITQAPESKRRPFTHQSRGHRYQCADFK
jgi:hypothetical protein